MTNEPPEKDGAASTRKLANEARAGDREAFERLYARLLPSLHAYAALQLGRRWFGADDLVAEVWLRASERFADYEAARPFRQWIFGFARNVVRETQRRLARGRGLTIGAGRVDSSTEREIPADITTVSRRIARDEDLRAFVDWVRSTLSDYELEVFVLRGLQGRKPKDVAEVLGRSERAIAVCWSQVLKRIKERPQASEVLAPLPGDPPTAADRNA